ncbi:MAG: site-specific integrase [Chloroflexota bacterium]
MTASGTLTTVSANQHLTVFHRLLMGKQSKLTRKAYSNDLKFFAQFLGFASTGNAHPLATLANEASTWNQFDPALIAAYLEYLKQTISPHTKRPYSTATIARRITAVKELLTEASYLGLFPRDHLEYIKTRIGKVQVTNEHHAGLTPGEQDAILRTASQQPGLKGIRDYVLFRLWLDTGLRRNELVSLRVRDVTTKEGISRIVVRFGKGKNGNQIREIAIEPYIRYELDEWLKLSGKVKYPDHPIFCQVRKFGRDDQAVYRVTNADKSLSGTALWKLVKWYCKKAGIKSEVVPHSFRVAMITDTINGGAPMQHIQRVTGHKSLDMITQVYDRNSYADPVARYRKQLLARRGNSSYREF